jgi:hypothetical protein
MKLVIIEGNEVIGQVDDYAGPVPRAGEYIHHPRGEQPVPGLYPDGTISVKVVAYGIIARPRNGEGHFVGAAEPFVEITV